MCMLCRIINYGNNNLPWLLKKKMTLNGVIFKYIFENSLHKNVKLKKF